MPPRHCAVSNARHLPFGPDYVGWSNTANAWAFRASRRPMSKSVIKPAMLRFKQLKTIRTRGASLVVLKAKQSPKSHPGSLLTPCVQVSFASAATTSVALVVIHVACCFACAVAYACNAVLGTACVTADTMVHRLLRSGGMAGACAAACC